MKLANNMNFEFLLGGIGRAVSNPQYRLFWISNGLSTTGRWIYRTAVAWLTWELTKSTFWLGVIAFADVFPMVALSIFSGAVSDRVGLLRVMKVMQLWLILVSICFSVLIFAGILSIELLLILTILHGFIEAMATPPRISIVKFLVKKDELSAAVALNSATFNACRVVGPAVGGGLLLFVEADLVFAVATLTFIQFYLIMFYLKPQGEASKPHVSQKLIRDMWDGILYAWNHPGLRFLMFVLAATGLLIRPFMEMAPGYAAMVFERGPDGLAMILSSIGAGALFASLWLAHRGRTEGLTRLVSSSFALTSILLIGFTLCSQIVLAMAFLAGIGFFMMVSGVSAQTLIQNATSSEMQTRAVSLFVLFNWGMPAVGALIMGWIATFFGLQFTIALGASLGLVFWLWSKREGRRQVANLEGDNNKNDFFDS